MDAASSPPATARVLIAGSSNTDLVARTTRLPLAGETVAGHDYAVHAGGKGANQAVAAARSGAGVTMVAAVGDDQHGSDRLADLQAEGIDTQHVVTVVGVPSGVALIAVEDSGENLIIFVPGANGHLQAAHVASAIEAERPAVVGLCLEIPLDAIELALRTARSIGALSVLNVAPWRDDVRPLLPLADVVIANESEVTAALGLDAERIPADSTALLEQVQSLGCPAVVITLGAAGAIFVDHDGSQGARRPPHVTPVDTTGAGDAFCGAVCSWLASGASLADAVRAGVATGALSTLIHGAQPSFPGREAILAALAGMPA